MPPIRLLAVVVLLSAARLHAAPTLLAITHRLADERAVAEHLPGTPTATIGDDTRYVLVAPVIEPVTLPDVPEVGTDGTLRLSVACPPALTGHDAVFTVALATAGATRAVPVHCPAGGPPIQISVPGLKPGPQLPVVKALGLPARVVSDWIAPAAGARLRVAVGLSGLRPGEKVGASRFRVLAESKRGGAPVNVLERVTASTAAGWTDLDVPLDTARRAAKGPYRLAFEVKLDPSAAGFPVWADPLVIEPASAGARPWSVLLVSLDTLRADRLGCYGATRATSPTLDKLAADGALFANTIAPASWTLPSHASLMTGLYPCVHGLVTGGLGHQLTPAVRPLAVRLRAAGYATAAYTEDAFLEPSAFQPGFSSYRADASVDGNDKVERTFGAAATWLRANGTAPFLLFVHTYQVHSPYHVPARYRQTFTTYDTPDGPRPLGEATGNTQELATYDTAIRYTDEALAPLLRTLDEVGVARRTIVVVTSDHGEAFWEHGVNEHGKTLYEEELHVPLLWRAPGLIPPGHRLADLVSLVDVTPTLLDLLGLEPAAPVQGRSLARLLRAATPPAPSRDAVVYAENAVHGFQLAVRTPTWKGVYEAEAAARVYQLTTDPGERQAGDAGPVVDQANQLRARFEKQCADLKSTVTAAASSLPTPTDLPRPDPAHEQQLRALGYVQ